MKTKLATLFAILSLSGLAADYYVDAVNGNDAWDGSCAYPNRVENASKGPRKTLASIMSIVAAGKGHVVHAAEGIYDEGSSSGYRVTIPKTTSLVADGAVEKTIIRGASSTDASADAYGCGTGALRGVNIANGSLLRGFTVCGGRVPAAYTLANSNANDGGGICGGTVVDCIVSNNVAYRGGGMASSTAIRCRLLDNRCGNYGTSIYWGAAYCCLIKGAGGKSDTKDTETRNCTFDGTAEESARGKNHYNGLLRKGYGTEVSLYNCIHVGPFASRAATLIDDACVKTNAAALTLDANWRPTGTNPAIDAGDPNYVTYPTIAADEAAYDLMGGARVSGSAIDIGCGEFQVAPPPDDPDDPPDDPDEPVDPGEVPESADAFTAWLQQKLNAAGDISVPAVTRTCHGVVIRSDTRLRFAAGTVLNASTNLTSWALPNAAHKALFTLAEGATNVTICGGATLDGNGASYDLVAATADKAGLIYGSGVRDVTICGLTLRNPSREAVAFDGYSRMLALSNLVIVANCNTPNAGIRLVASDVIVSGCDIDASDEAIAISCPDVTRIVENIEIRESSLASSASFVRYGEQSFGLFRNLWVHDVSFAARTAPTIKNYRSIYHAVDYPGGYDLFADQPNGIAAVAVACMDGGAVENVRLNDLTIGSGVQVPVFLRHGARWTDNLSPWRDSLGYFRNVEIANVTGAAASRIAATILGTPGKRISNVLVRNYDLEHPGGATVSMVGTKIAEHEADGSEPYLFGSVFPGFGFYVRHADDVRFEHCRFHLAQSDARSQMVASEDSTDLGFFDLAWDYLWDTIPLGGERKLNWPTAFVNEPVFAQAAPVRPEGLVLYENGVATPIRADSRYAALAAELAWHLKRMTGADFTVTTSDPGKACVWFRYDSSVALGRTVFSTGDDGSLVISAGGSQAYGASHGLTYLLEALGCRYLWPGKTGKVIPKNQTRVVAPKLDFSYASPFKSRHWRSVAASDDAYLDDPANRSYSAWHGIEETEESIAYGHQYGDWYQRYHDTHPEWFALQPDGTRDQNLGPYTERPTFCLSCEGFVEAAAQMASSGGNSVSICLPDGGRPGQCMCKACRRLDPPTGNPITLSMPSPVGSVEYVSLSDRYFHFYNAVAALVPNKKLGVYAYSDFSDLPLVEKPAANLDILTTIGSYVRSAALEESRAILAGWASIPNRKGWRPNAAMGIGVAIPIDFAAEIYQDMARVGTNGYILADHDTVYDNWATRGLIYYAIAKSYVNPDLLDWSLLYDDYCRTGFGAGYAKVREYFDYVRSATLAVRNTTGSDAMYDFIVNFNAAACRTMLNEARTAAVGDDDSIARIDLLLKGLDTVEVEQAYAAAWRDSYKNAWYEARQAMYDWVSAKQAEEGYENPLVLDLKSYLNDTNLFTLHRYPSF